MYYWPGRCQGLVYLVCINAPWAITWSFIFGTVILVSCPILSACRTADPAPRVHVLKCAACSQDRLETWWFYEANIMLFCRRQTCHIHFECIFVIWLKNLLLFYCILEVTEKMSLEQWFLTWFEFWLWLSVFLKA